MENVEAAQRRNQQAHRRLYRRLDRKYPGQFIGIVNGEVAAIAGSFEEVISKLTSIEPNPSRRLVFRAGDEYLERGIIL